MSSRNERDLTGRLCQLICVGAAVLTFGAQAAHATLSITTTSTPATDIWEPESGGAVAAGTGGIVNGALTTSTWDNLVFTYTGDGDSLSANEVYFTNGTVTTRAEAEAKGWAFCTAAAAACGGLATTIGSSIDVPQSGPGLVGFHFVFSTNGVVNNGDALTVDNPGAFLDTIEPIGAAANAGPGTVAVVGLADSTYPGDHDFQDLTFTAAVPEPMTMSLLGLGFAGLQLVRRRKERSFLPA